MFNYQTAVQHWVNRLGFQLRAEVKKRLQEAGIDLTPEEWAMMMILWRDEAASVGELSKRTLRDRTTVTRVLDRLVAKELIERHSAKADRRTVMVAATDKGKGIQTAVLTALAPVIRNLTEDIAADDLEVTLRTLQAMSERLEK